MKFRKKAIIVNGEQWLKHGDNPLVYPYCETVLHVEDKICEQCGEKMSFHGIIGELEGDHRVCPEDWIMTGIKGEHWAIKPDILKLTYDPVEE